MTGFKQHALVPKLNHDEHSRQAFVLSLRSHLSGKVMPGTYGVYKTRVEPAFKTAHGRAPQDEHEVREVMTRDPYYQFWSAMQRRSQELSIASTHWPRQEFGQEKTARRQ
jgi:hypothetical protein